MRVLVVGSGGREHALTWAIAASPLVDRLYSAPGNAGIAEEAECVPIRATDIAGLVAFCRRERIDFVVVGPHGQSDRAHDGVSPKRCFATAPGSASFLRRTDLLVEIVHQACQSLPRMSQGPSSTPSSDRAIRPRR